VVGLERGLGSKRVEKFETRGWTEGHSERDGTIQLHDRRWCELRERVIERNDAWPVRFPWQMSARVTRGDCSLERVRAAWVGERFGAVERSQTTMDEELIPPGAVLIE
jgi:hypothetical protein